MIRRSLILLCAAASAALGVRPALAEGTAAVAAVDLPVHGHRLLVARQAHEQFTLVGLHWSGSGRVAFRTRSVGGRWTPWRPAAPETEDRPDWGSPESRPGAGWRIGNPWWVPLSDRVQVRPIGQVSRIRVYLVRSSGIRMPVRNPAATTTPAIVPRASWGADESIRRGPPVYAPALRFAIVHHTAGRNDYTRAEAPAIVKAIELYHVQGNGWNDIGYNFLVDRFGTIYEGRFGGVDRNVVGAHALGFNTGSVGIALIGTYGTTEPSQAAQDALARLLAWRLDLAHVDPLSTVSAVSGGSDRYPNGTPVLLRAVSGHRDTGLTECPGDALYARLGSIAATAARLGQPKIFEPRVDGNVGGLLRFRARLSQVLPWTVSVIDDAGAEVARGTGTSMAVDWTWDSALALPGTYSWTISAGSARTAGGTLAVRGVPSLAIRDLSAAPATITPNGDDQDDVSVLSFGLTAPATVTAQVVDAAGDVLATVLARTRLSAGEHVALVNGVGLPDGRYTIVVSARAGNGAEASAAAAFAVSRTLGEVSLAPDVFSPNGDGRRDRLEIRFSLGAPADAGVRIVQDGRWVATPLPVTSLSAGAQRVVWDGHRPGGLRDGFYSAAVVVTDSIGTSSFAVPFQSDTEPPQVKILSVHPLRLEVSEPCTLVVRVDRTELRRTAQRAGIVAIPWIHPVRRIRAVAWDAAGNASAPAVARARRGG